MTGRSRLVSRINAGLRWDYFGHWGTYYNSQTPFPFFQPGSGSDFATQIANGAMTIHGGSSAYVTVNRPSGFDPRFGFGWDVFGNGKMAVRGGYGWYYNNVADGSWSFPSRANPPTWANPSLQSHQQLASIHILAGQHGRPDLADSAGHHF